MARSSKSERSPASAWARARRRLGEFRRRLLTPRPRPLPPDFDWQAYLAANPDLGFAGIDDEDSARRHWQHHGAREGRPDRNAAEAAAIDAPPLEIAPPEAQQPAAAPPDPEEPDAPPGFDWRWYVTSYTDLPLAGIDDEAAAIRHWRESGRAEGRRYAAKRSTGFDWLAYVDRFAKASLPSHPAPASSRLVCPSADSLFLRAWGELCCWDDAGGDLVLVGRDPGVDYAERLRNGPYQKIRDQLAAGRLPWPDVCQKCLLLRVHPEPERADWDRRSVRMLRVEPSYYCTLDCPGCVPLSVRQGHQQDFQLDPATLDRIVADLVAAGLEIDAIDFQGHGEPVLNPRLWEMARRCRERSPESWITVTTNAQAKFRPHFVESGLDEVNCAIDGVDAASYEPYRVNGDFELAWRFMTEFTAAGRSSSRQVRVVWKYVVFEHNSAPEQLLAAQRMALEAGVAELVFVLTRNGPVARDIRVPEDVPRLRPGPPLSFRFHHAAIEDLEARVALARRSLGADLAPGSAALLDSVRANAERFFGPPAEHPERLQKLLAALDRT